MSETAISRLTISRPLALRTFRLRLFLLTLVSLKFPEVFRLTSRFCGVVLLGSRPRSFSGHSILMISAPKAPSQRVAHGPARTQLKSTTRMFSRARGRDMVSFSCYGQPQERRSSPGRDAALMSDRLAQPILPAVLILTRSHCLRLIEREADKAEHQQRGEPERYAAEHMLLLCVPSRANHPLLFAA